MAGGLSSLFSRWRSSARRFTLMLDLHCLPDVLPDGLNVIATLSFPPELVDSQPMVVRGLDVSQVANINGTEIAGGVEKLLGNSIRPPTLVGAAQKESCADTERDCSCHEFLRRFQVCGALGGWHENEVSAA